ncbi:MAG: hypothetical protein ACPF8V_12330, partial [Luteibaculum sp.]
MRGNDGNKIYKDGEWVGTGQLVNNTSNNGVPYVLTSSGNAAPTFFDDPIFAFEFNYESIDCSRKIPRSKTYTGAISRVYRSNPDFGLLEMHKIPVLLDGIFYLGWDLSTISPDFFRIIHHPRGDIKSTFNGDSGTVEIPTFFNGQRAHNWIFSRSTGFIPKEESGAAVLDNKLLIRGIIPNGQNITSCNGNSTGLFASRIDSGFNATISSPPTTQDSTRSLRLWLDPANTGLDSLPGFNPDNRPELDLAIEQVRPDPNILCGEMPLDLNVRVHNSGTLTISPVRFRLIDSLSLDTVYEGQLAEAVSGNQSKVLQLKNLEIDSSFSGYIEV